MNTFFLLFLLLLLLGLFQINNSECPNACSGRGKCGAFSVCECYRNYFGNDCSLRLCPFGRSYIDAPKGDLDSSNENLLSGPSTRVLNHSQIYPHGTVETWTTMDLTLLNGYHDVSINDNTAHGYSECSNAGKCDYTEGKCECFEGYEGSSCQRFSCPVVAAQICHGHGTCSSIGKWAELDNRNIYELWDKDMTHGCKCDSGWTGAGCENRECIVGIDPLYFASEQVSSRYANWTFVLSHGSALDDATIRGTFTITFYDIFGEDYTTNPIIYNAPCSDLIKAIEDLPNHYVRAGNVYCLKYPDYHKLNLQEPFNHTQRGRRWGVKYTVVLPKLYGKTKQPHINRQDLGSGLRATLEASDKDDGRLGTYTYANGFTGENIDYVPDLCENVDVNLFKTNNGYDILDGLTFIEKRLLQKCLGEADGKVSTTSDSGSVLNEVYTWDYGDYLNPHLIKLVDATVNATTDLCEGAEGNERDLGVNERICHLKRPPGFYVILYYYQPLDEFRVFTPVARDFGNNTDFWVFTTTGTMQMVSEFSAVRTLPHQYAYERTVFTVNSTTQFADYIGAIDCESNPVLNSGLLTCVKKGDKIFLLDKDMTYESHQSNPSYPNMYTIEKAYIMDSQTLARGPKARLLLDYSVTGSWDVPGNNARVYKFTPPEGTEYVGPCSFRGECDVDSGLCSCHIGYYGEDCSNRYIVNSGYSAV